MSFNDSLRRSAALFSAVLAASASQAFAGTITGRVTDASGDVALEGAIITIAETGQRVTTDRAGDYRLNNVDAGTVTLNVSYVGAEAAAVTVTLDSADARVNQDITLGEDVRVLDNVLVTGQRGAFYASLNRERAADGLIEVLSADAIGSLPDQNVAESARRIPGVSVANDQGEGRFVIIRGIDPSLNAVSINGVRLPSPEADTRAVALDVVDSDVLSSIVVSKTFSADMDGDGIGGAIDIETLSAFDQDGRMLRIKAEGIYSELTENWGEKFSLTASDTFLDGRLGIAGSITYNRRDFGSENIEVDGGFAADGINQYPEELELRDYLIERERTSATLNFDYRLNTSTAFYLRTLYNDFSDQEFRSRVEIKLDDAEFAGVTTQGNDLIALFNEGDEIEYDRDIKDRLETQQIWSIQLGGETATDNGLTWDYGVTYTHAEEEEPNRLDTDFRADDVGDATDSALYGLRITDPRSPRPVNVDDATFGYFNTADNFEFDGAEFLNGLTEDDEYTFFLNLQRDGNVFGVPGFVKGGVKARLREKSFDVEASVFDGFDSDDDLLLSQFAGTVDYPLADIGPVPAPGPVRSFFNSNRSSFELNPFDTVIDSTGEDFEADENIYAAYLMAQINPASDFRVTGGLRLEATDYSAQATPVSFEEGTFADATVLGGEPVGFFGTNTVLDISDENDNGVFDEGDEYELVSVGTRTERNSYVDVLPSIASRYMINEDTIFRASYYRSISRPNIGAVVPTALIEIDEGDIEAEIGNPELDRQRSDNFDLSLEYYPSDDAVVSAGIFYKDINDYIGGVVRQDFVLNGVAFDEVSTFENLGSTEITGVEFAYSNVFNDLPAPFDGFLISASYTYLNGDITLQDGRTVPAPLLSENVGSLVVGYDKDGFDFRAALSYRSEYLDEIGTGGAGIDRFVDGHLQLDLEAQYDITDQIEIQLELQNITDEPFEAFLKDGSQKLLSQYEEYGYTARVGLRYRY